MLAINNAHTQYGSYIAGSKTDEMLYIWLFRYTYHYNLTCSHRVQYLCSSYIVMIFCVVKALAGYPGFSAIDIVKMQKFSQHKYIPN